MKRLQVLKDEAVPKDPILGRDDGKKIESEKKIPQPPQEHLFLLFFIHFQTVLRREKMKQKKQQHQIIAPETLDCKVCQKLKSNIANKTYCFDCFTTMLKECDSCHLPFFKPCSFEFSAKQCNKCFQKKMKTTIKKMAPSKKKKANSSWKICSIFKDLQTCFGGKST